MKQTAVEQFIEQLEQQGDSWENVSMGTINISIKVDDYLKLKEKAKEMENEQAERMYSEEEVLELLNKFRVYSYHHGCGSSELLEWFEQIKNIK